MTDYLLTTAINDDDLPARQAINAAQALLGALQVLRCSGPLKRERDALDTLSRQISMDSIRQARDIIEARRVRDGLREALTELARSDDSQHQDMARELGKRFYIGGLFPLSDSEIEELRGDDARDRAKDMKAEARAMGASRCVVDE